MEGVFGFRISLLFAARWGHMVWPALLSGTGSWKPGLYFWGEWGRGREGGRSTMAVLGKEGGRHGCSEIRCLARLGGAGVGKEEGLTWEGGRHGCSEIRWSRVLVKGGQS